jgi:CRISPR/Cas system CSM-associated protein Csm5 (group 7 of RAMP superfamily)
MATEENKLLRQHVIDLEKKIKDHKALIVAQADAMHEQDKIIHSYRTECAKISQLLIDNCKNLDQNVHLSDAVIVLINERDAEEDAVHDFIAQVNSNWDGGGSIIDGIRSIITLLSG